MAELGHALGMDASSQTDKGSEAVEAKRRDDFATDRARIWIAAGITDLRYGFTGLSVAVQTILEQDPFGGHVFVFRGRRGDLIKLFLFIDD